MVAVVAIVLPDGTLFGEGVKTSIKEKLLTECNLHTIVRLPNGVFNPYTSIKTNLLFFTKGEPTREIWFYEHPYPAGVKSYNKTKPIRIEEFDTEKSWWFGEKPKKKGKAKAVGADLTASSFAYRIETPQAWKVAVEQVQANGYNLDLKNPHNSDPGPRQRRSSAARIRKALAQIAITRAALKQELHQALTCTAGTAE